jgi:hypothetical protein
MLKEALRQLLERPQLKVSFIRDFLEAFLRELPKNIIPKNGFKRNYVSCNTC